MSNEEKEKPAPAIVGNGPLKIDPPPRGIDSAGSTPAIDLQAVRRRRDQFLDELEAMAAWKEDLTKRIARAQLRFNYVDCLSGEYDALRAELDEFLVVSHALVGQTPDDEGAAT